MTEPTAREDPHGLAAVENLMQFLLKGLRAVQLYLPNNPVYQRACTNVRTALGPVWEHCSELHLQVTESDLIWEETPVLSQPNRAESMAWVLFKDGIRLLSLLPGVEDAEIIQFLSVIHQARTLPDDAPDDLLTLLWEQDFQTVRYQFVELGAEESPALKTSGAKPKVSAAAVKREVKEAQEQPETEEGETEEEQAERPPGVVQIDEQDSTLYFLDEREVEYLRGEVEREYRHDLRGNVLAVLFDLLELQTYSTVRAEIISIVENFIPYLLAVGDFSAVALVLREVRVVLERAREVLPEQREALKDLPAKLSEPEALGQLLQSLDEAVVHPTEVELGDLFRELRPEALQTLLSWLPRLSNERVRELVKGSARRLAQANPEQVVAALETPEVDALVETVRLVAELKLPPVVSALGQLLQDQPPEVKRSVVEALSLIGSPSAMKHLETAIDDGDREVRIGAVRALASRGHRAAFPKIESALKNRTLRNADLTEKTAFFEAYGLLAGPSGIAMLRPMIETKGFMRRKEDAQTRACAAMALGKIASPEAKSILERVAGDKEPLVRNAVNKALRELA